MNTINMYDVARRIYGSPVKRMFTEKPEDKRSKYTASEKNKALTVYSELKTFSEAEKSTGIPRNTIRCWYNEAKSGVMKRSPKNNSCSVKADDRRDNLVELVTGEAMGVEYISEVLRASDSTIRKDILVLMAAGRIKDISDKPNARFVIAA